jgi:hypothetical protein
MTKQKKEKKVFQPISEKQSMFFNDKTTDVIFLGGGR